MMYRNLPIFLAGFSMFFACKARPREGSKSSLQGLKTRVTDFGEVPLVPLSQDILTADEAELDSKFESYEISQAHEQRVHSILVDLSVQMLAKTRSGNPHGKVARDAHAKSHGCLRAWFDVDNSKLDERHRVGFFGKNATYKAYLRFSNNDQMPVRKDGERDLRGMAIKVFGVDFGQQILKSFAGSSTIDFLMYGHKRFFIANNEDYLGFIDGIRGGDAKKRLLTEQTVGAINTFKAQSEIFDKTNPLDIQYFSATPVRLGRGDDPSRTAMKYGVEPCADYASANVSGKDKFDYMRDNLIASLKTNKEICFKFKIQPQTFPETMPIEDSTVYWPEEKGSILSGISNREKFQPYIEVGKIRFSYNENFDIPNNNDMTEVCEDMSFTPWRTISEHRPLGRTMRMRRDLYLGISNYRRLSNGASLAEPQPWSIPGK